ncbi:MULTISPECIES: hypothetical protein [unclassified Variovorax]|jgi:hypothetical protein|uniref:hypothetical protein n=1 Tax=unclassified Variovorax TaxID=663243 RepID=UPI000F7DD9D6|nr:MULTISPECIES: hypothetical protein [unclassified Variovorax]RSZ33336.1 hypothetical protein EJO70_29105 [Variovorax sp. 553]RSZ33708.1 hypothetical protein EJO71_29105 [Variovorax sp. 679]
MDFALIECSRIDWSKYEEVQGRADSIPLALEALLSSSIEEAEKYYWEIENHVVVQGQLSSAAEPTLQVLIASLLNARPRHTKIDVLELIFQIVAASIAEVVNEECKEIQRRVRLRALEGVWVFYGELNGEHAEAASEVLNLIDSSRFKFFLDAGR